MLCPKCKDVSLHKNNHEEPYSCIQCKGVWIQSEEIKKLTEYYQDGEGENSLAPKDHDGKTGVCPAGHGIMLRAGIDVDQPFYLERCTICGGIWFDKGELQQVLENRLVDNLEDFWSQSWQRKFRKEKSREEYIKLNREVLGEDLLELVLTLSAELKNHPERNRALALLKQEVLEGSL